MMTSVIPFTLYMRDPRHIELIGSVLLDLKGKCPERFEYTLEPDKWSGKDHYKIRIEYDIPYLDADPYFADTCKFNYRLKRITSLANMLYNSPYANSALRSYMDERGDI